MSFLENGTAEFESDVCLRELRGGLGVKGDREAVAKYETAVPILCVPAIAFLYIFSKAGAEWQNGKL